MPRAQHIEFLALSHPSGRGTPTPLWRPILMARLYRGKRNRGAEEPMKLLLRPRSNPALAATVIAVPIAMMTRSCGLPGKLDDDAAQTAAEAAHAGQNGAHLFNFSQRDSSPPQLSANCTL